MGLSRHTLARLVAQGQWQRLTPGLFVTHSTTVTWPALAWGGVLLGGDRSRLGGRAAAHAHGLVDEPPDPVEVLVPHDVIVRRRPHWVFTRERPASRSPRTTGSPPRILVADTVLDLCDGKLAPCRGGLGHPRRPATAHHAAAAAPSVGRPRSALLQEPAHRAAHGRGRGSGIAAGGSATCVTSSGRTACRQGCDSARAPTALPCATCSTRSTPSSSSSTAAAGTRVRAGSGTCDGTTLRCSPGSRLCATGSGTWPEVRATWPGRLRSC